jgi:serine/threonine protein phosphatase 1
VLDARLPRVPDDWTVWAFSDPHGSANALSAALREAELIDDAGRWSAPPGTALVGCGDYVDRGGDVRGTVDLLRRLGAEAAASGGLAVFARGNHEQMVLHVRAGRVEWAGTWARYGGQATLASYAVAPIDPRDPNTVPEALDAMERASPGLFRWLEGLPHAVRWRDVLLVHGGLPIDHGPEDFGTTTDEHLWIRAAFYETPWDAAAFDRYRHAGIGRVVFGHTAQADGPTLFHGGRSLCIDTNAVGDPGLPSSAKRALTLVRLTDDARWDGARFITIPTADTPDRP